MFSAILWHQVISQCVPDTPPPPPPLMISTLNPALFGEFTWINSFDLYREINSTCVSFTGLFIKINILIYTSTFVVVKNPKHFAEASGQESAFKSSQSKIKKNWSTWRENLEVTLNKSGVKCYVIIYMSKYIFTLLHILIIKFEC